MPTSPRRARATRRFSSSAVGATWNPKFTQISPSTSTPILRARGRSHRRTSSVGRYTTVAFSDSSELDEEQCVLSRSEGSDTSSQRQFAMAPEPRPKIYTSLPPSPILSPTVSSVLVPQFPASPITREPPIHPPFSLWDYLREELLATDFDSHQELKWERVSNFLSIPLAVEKVSPIVNQH